MRTFLGIVAFFAFSAGACDVSAAPRVAAREPTADEQTAMNELGKRFLLAVADGDDKQSLDCWTKAEWLEPELRKRLGDEGVAEFLKYLKNRDEIAAAYIPLLKRFLDREVGGADKLKFERLTGLIKPEDGFVQTTAFHLTFSGPDGVECRYRIDDGILWKDVWYFQDKPEGTVEMRRNGKTVRVQLTDFATEAERERIKALQAR